MGLFRRRAWRLERDAVAQELLEEIADLGYEQIVDQFVLSEVSEHREVTAPSGQTVTLQVEAWWEDEQARTVHVSVAANRGPGLRISGAGPWILLNPPEPT